MAHFHSAPPANIRRHSFVIILNSISTVPNNLKEIIRILMQGAVSRWLLNASGWLNLTILSRSQLRVCNHFPQESIWFLKACCRRTYAINVSHTITQSGCNSLIHDLISRLEGPQSNKRNPVAIVQNGVGLRDDLWEIQFVSSHVQSRNRAHHLLVDGHSNRSTHPEAELIRIPFVTRTVHSSLQWKRGRLPVVTGNHSDTVRRFTVVGQ